MLTFVPNYNWKLAQPDDKIFFFYYYFWHGDLDEIVFINQPILKLKINLIMIVFF